MSHVFRVLSRRLSHNILHSKNAGPLNPKPLGVIGVLDSWAQQPTTRPLGFSAELTVQRAVLAFRVLGSQMGSYLN